MLCADLFNSFTNVALFLHSLKTSENLHYRSGALAENGLKIARRNPVDTRPILNLNPENLVNLVNVFRSGPVDTEKLFGRCPK